MKKTFLLITTCLLLSSISAQVTIGSGQAPNKGALLDLKTETDGSSKLGLGLPRVELTELAPASNADLAKSIGNTTGSYDMTEHIGLIVYNVKDAVFDPATCVTTGAPLGLHVWDGSKWQGIATKGMGAADPGEGIVGGKLIDREGNDYYIATFGTAGTWMTENLRTKTAPRLVAMTESAANSTTDMHYAYPNGGYPYVGKPIGWTNEQGLLYNWHATMNKITCNTTDQGQVVGAIPGANEVETTDGFIQGICPSGWHVPSDREWNQLEAETTNKASLYAQTLADGTWDASWETIEGGMRSNPHGTAMKSTTDPNGQTTIGDSKTAANGGIDIVYTGFAYNGSTDYFATRGYSWSSSSNSGTNTWTRVTYSGDRSVSREKRDRNNLYSVRCKKD